MRIKADITEQERRTVKEWADARGYTMPKAYGELLTTAIETRIGVVST